MTAFRENLYLVGYRGCGKSTVGRRLAAGLERPFFDADELFVARAGRTIAAFIRDCGWEEFRRLESEILAEFSRRPEIVFATGGGVVLNPDNRARLRSGGRVVWLKAGFDETVRRLLQDPLSPDQRPPLEAGLGPAEEIARGLREREPLYREVADLTVEVDRLSPAQIVAAIREFIDRPAS